MKRILIIVFIMSSALASSLLANNYDQGDTVVVVALNGLSLRSAPSIDGEKKIVLPSGTDLVVLDTLAQGSRSDVIFGFAGKWIAVQTLDHESGYVFDAFVSTLNLPGPDITKYTSDNNYFIQGRLEMYVEENYNLGCEIEYGNLNDIEGAHEMKLSQIDGGGLFVQHQYHEGSGAELRLEDVRLSEVFYLIHHLLQGVEDLGYTINDHQLRNPKRYNRRQDDCVVRYDSNCHVAIEQRGEGAYTIIFNAPCC